MGRKPIGKRPMTDAERQQRRRKKLRKAKLKLGKKAIREKKLAAAANEYIPTPPGITYWRRVKVQTVAGERIIWQPTTRPLASVNWSELTEDDLATLAEHLESEKKRRQKGSGLAVGGGVGVCSAEPPADL